FALAPPADVVRRCRRAAQFQILAAVLEPPSPLQRKRRKVGRTRRALRVRKQQSSYSSSLSEISVPNYKIQTIGHSLSRSLLCAAALIFELPGSESVRTLRLRNRMLYS